MPENAIDKTVTELNSPTVYTDIGNSDYLYVAHYDSVNQEYVNWRVSVTEFASKVLKNIEFTSDLETTSKIIINAINEIAQGGGGGGASSLSELTDVTITSPSTGQVLTYDAVTNKWVNGAGAELALTGEVIGSICSFNDGSDNQPLKSWKTTITPIQAGTGTPAPDNIRALSARTQIVATKTKANLLGGSKLLANAQAYISGTTDLENKTFTFSASTTPDTSKSFTGDLTYKFKENTRYTFIITGSGSSSTPRLNLRVYYTDGTYSAITNPSAQNTKETVVFVSTAGKTVRSLNKYTGSGTTILYYDECGIFEGVVGASDFEAYDAVSKTISLGTSIVGGELDIKNGGGKSQYGYLTLNGSESWGAVASINGYRLQISDMKSGSQMVGWCDWLSSNSNDSLSIAFGASSVNNKYIYCNNVNDIDGISDATSWKNYLSNNNLHIVYPLETPVEFTTQAEDFNTSEGENQFYTDCGISDVVYFNSMTDDVVDICNEVVDSKVKVLTGTLAAGNTTITFTDNSLTSNCTKTLYVDDAFFGVAPTAMVADYVNHSVTYTFPVQASNMPVKLEVK